MKTFTVNQKTNLKDFTDSVYPQGSFYFTRLLNGRDIRVNGIKAGKNIAVDEGDVVCYYTTPEQEAKPSHRVIYADERVYIADKFSGVSCEALACELGARGFYKPVHRLDRNTSGVIAFARSENSELELLAAFKERRVKKVYQCVCLDNFKRNEALLTAYLKKDAGAAKVKIYSAPTAGAVKIVTEYKILKRFDGCALAEVTLHTGKTHQIRAHMAYIGCPVLGDEKYGDEAFNASRNAKRQRLVAKQLQFNLSGGLAYLNDKIFESSFSPETNN